MKKESQLGRVSKLLVTFGALVLLLVSYLLYVVWLSMPVLRGEVMSAEVLDRVEVTRDNYGVPKIWGNRNNDVFFAQGYTHAQDRLFQMQIMKHMFLGRMSEILGKKTLGLDRYMRLFNLEEASQSSYAYFSPSSKQMLESYAAGVNQYISENRPTLEARLVGMNVEPWRPQDSVVIQKAMAFDLSRHWPRIMRNTALAAEHGNEVLQTYFPEELVVEPSVLDSDLKRHRLPYTDDPEEFPDGPQIPQEVVDSFETYARLNDAVLSGMSSDETLAPGSNIWAVSGKRSESKKPLMASDPHLSYNVPNTFYLVNLKSPTMEITGASIPGSPGVIIGRNNTFAWGFTNAKLAQSDIFYGKDISGKVLRKEIFKVSGGDDVEVTYTDTDYGTLISDEGAPYEVALNWLGMAKVDTTLEALFNFNAASSIKEAKKSIKLFRAPAQNMAMTDADGNMALFVLGEIPIRHHSGRIAVPATPEFQWKKSIPYWEMPYAENPPRGYVMNANNYPVSEHYPYNLSKLGFDDLRAIQLVKRLNAQPSFSMDDMKDIQMDNSDQQWGILRDVLLNVKPTSALGERALSALESWDGVAVRDSYEVTIFSMWHREIGSRVYKHISKTVPGWARPVHDDFFVLNSLRNNLQDCHTEGGDCQDFLAETLDAALASLTKRYGTEDITQWAWEGSHQAVFKHPIFKKVPLLKSWTARQAKVDGTRDSLNRSRWFAGDGGFMGTQGACLRMIVDMSNPYGQFSIPMGASGNIFSKHYDDLLPVWAEGEYLTLPQRQSKGHEAHLVFSADHSSD